MKRMKRNRTDTKKALAKRTKTNGKRKPPRRARRPAARNKAKAPPAAADAIALLKADHRAVEGLFERLSSTQAPAQRGKLLERIKEELQAHTAIEEEVFYPAFREASARKDDRRLFHEAIEEHHVVDVVLPDVEKADPASNSFAARAKVLKEIVEHHVEEEEKEMFPRARKVMSREELRELGARMAEQKNAGARGGPLRAVASFVGITR